MSECGGANWCIFFFFSSRRRHTRSDRDWSSDVCSSDLSLRWSGILHEWSAPTSRFVMGVLPYGAARAVLSIFRSIPEYVWAFLFVRAVGLGPFAGVLAIGVAYGGMLGKVYSEVFEAANPRPLEALHAAGAGKSGILSYALLPEVLP